MTARTAVGTAEPDEPNRRRTKGRRNVNGEGNIRQRSDGRWEGRAYVITTDGREVRKSVYGKGWDDVHDKLTKLQADTMSGKRVASTNMTVGEYAEYWLREHARLRVRDTTYASYRWMVREYLVSQFGNKKLVKLRPRDIRRGLFQLKQTCQCCARGKDQARADRAAAQLAKRAGKPPRKNARKIQGARCCAKTPPECCRAVVSDGSIRYVHRLLRAMLQDAVNEDELITENVAKGLRLDHKYRPKFRAWTPDEARRFLRSVMTERLYALYVVALTLGLRRSEILGLRWPDIDIDGGTISVSKRLCRVDGKLTLGPVKTDSSVRVVAMPADCIRALREHRERQAKEREIAGTRWQEGGYVFTTLIGTPIEPRNLARHFDALMVSADVPRIRFHDLRHSCASLLYGQGVKLENIQDVLGHSSPTVTKMIYVDVAAEVHREAVERLGFLFDEDEREDE